MTEKHTGTNPAIVFFIGAVIGTAIGLLYAPRSGRETRAMLREKAQYTTKKAREAARRVKEKAIKAEHGPESTDE